MLKQGLDRIEMDASELSGGEYLVRVDQYEAQGLMIVK
jgi:hypothetical protein